jgi:Fe-S cluster assembly protein SufD
MNDVQDSAAKASAAFTLDFPGRLASVRGKEPAWLTKAREDAHASFVESGLPTRKLEAWRYANVAVFSKLPLSTQLTSQEKVASDELPPASSAAGSHRIVLIDGRFAGPPLSDALGTNSAPGLRVESLASAVLDGSTRLQPSLAAPNHRDHSFAALNLALLSDGVVVTIAANAEIEKPIEIVSLTSGGGVAQHSRVIVIAGANSKATLVEHHASLGPGASFANIVVDVELADGANLEHVKVADEHVEAVHVAATRVRQSGRDSNYESTVVSLGGAFHRHSLYVDLLAPGASCDLKGLYVLRGAQNHDHYTVIDHAVPHTTSEEHYKAVLDEKSRGTFFGRILVRKDAQKTASAQKNDNLLLSNDALANSTPQLEIFADDVKCAHGSTIGQLDAQSLYYLRSRGIDRAAARELLTYAFANEILDTLTLDPLRERLARRLTREPQSEHVATEAP